MDDIFGLMHKKLDEIANRNRETWNAMWMIPVAVIVVSLATVLVLT